MIEFLGNSAYQKYEIRTAGARQVPVMGGITSHSQNEDLYNVQSVIRTRFS